MAQTYGELFAANMRAARARAGISQKTLAARMQRLGFDSWFDTKVSRAERALVPVEASELLGLAVSLSCTLRDLVGEAPPDAVIAFPDPAFHVTGVMVRNSGYGWNDASITWPPAPGDYPVITVPANAQSAFAHDKSHLLGTTEPRLFTRTMGTVEQIKHDHPELARPAS